MKKIRWLLAALLLLSFVACADSEGGKAEEAEEDEEPCAWVLVEQTALESDLSDKQISAVAPKGERGTASS